MKIFYAGYDYITENGVELVAHCEDSGVWCAMFGNARLKYFKGVDASFEVRKFMKKFSADNFEVVNV